MGEVVDIGEMRITRERRRYLAGDGCLHKHLELDDQGDVVSCLDCKKQVSAFWAFSMFVAYYVECKERLDRERQRFREETSKEIVLLAAKKVEKAWRSRSMVPSCPHCHRGILPSDRFGDNTVNKEFELRRRAKPKPTDPQP